MNKQKKPGMQLHGDNVYRFITDLDLAVCCNAAVTIHSSW